MRRLFPKSWFACFLVLAFVLGGASQEKKRPAWKLVESLQFDWDKDGKSDSFVLEVPEDWDSGGDSSRLTIRMSGGKAFVLENELGWMDFTEDVFSRTWASKNVVASPHFLFLRTRRGAESPPLLFLIGWGYASSPGSLHVIKLTTFGTPKLILYRAELELKDFTDLNGDGINEIVGLPCYSQTWGEDLLTYDPFHVFVLPGETGMARFSLKLTRNYNLKHYYGWAGPECSEKLAVVLHPPGGGKPKIMKAADAEKLPEKKSQPKK